MLDSKTFDLRVNGWLLDMVIKAFVAVFERKVFVMMTIPLPEDCTVKLAIKIRSFTVLLGGF